MTSCTSEFYPLNIFNDCCNDQLFNNDCSEDELTTHLNSEEEMLNEIKGDDSLIKTLYGQEAWQIKLILMNLIVIANQKIEDLKIDADVYISIFYIYLYIFIYGWLITFGCWNKGDPDNDYHFTLFISSIKNSIAQKKPKFIMVTGDNYYPFDTEDMMFIWKNRIWRRYR